MLTWNDLGILRQYKSGLRMSGLSEANPSIEQLSFANKQLRSAAELQTDDDDLEIVQMESI